MNTHGLRTLLYFIPLSLLFPQDINYPEFCVFNSPLKNIIFQSHFLYLLLLIFIKSKRTLTVVSWMLFFAFVLFCFLHSVLCSQDSFMLSHEALFYFYYFIIFQNVDIKQAIDLVSS